MPLGTAQGSLTFELCRSEVQVLVQALKRTTPGDLGDPSSASLLAATTKSFEEALVVEPSKDVCDWSSCLVVLDPQTDLEALQLLFACLVSSWRNDALPAAASVLERVRNASTNDKASSRAIVEPAAQVEATGDSPNSDSVTQGKSFKESNIDAHFGMVSEYNSSSQHLQRLKSFSGRWPHPESQTIAPHRLAAAGFFLSPLSVESSDSDVVRKIPLGADRCQCFCCGAVCAAWDPTAEPWAEHRRLKSTCQFLAGKATSNVPLAVTTGSLPWFSIPSAFGLDDAVISSVQSYPADWDVSGFDNVAVIAETGSSEWFCWLHATPQLRPLVAFDTQSLYNVEEEVDVQMVFPIDFSPQTVNFDATAARVLNPVTRRVSENDDLKCCFGVLCKSTGTAMGRWSVRIVLLECGTFVQAAGWEIGVDVVGASWCHSERKCAIVGKERSGQHFVQVLDLFTPCTVSIVDDFSLNVDTEDLVHQKERKPINCWQNRILFQAIPEVGLVCAVYSGGLQPLTLRIYPGAASEESHSDGNGDALSGDTEDDEGREGMEEGVSKLPVRLRSDVVGAEVAGDSNSKAVADAGPIFLFTLDAVYAQHCSITLVVGNQIISHSFQLVLHPAFDGTSSPVEETSTILQSEMDLISPGPGSLDLINSVMETSPLRIDYAVPPPGVRQMIFTQNGGSSVKWRVPSDSTDRLGNHLVLEVGLSAPCMVASVDMELRLRGHTDALPPYTLEIERVHPLESRSVDRWKPIMPSLDLTRTLGKHSRDTRHDCNLLHGNHVHRLSIYVNTLASAIRLVFTRESWMDTSGKRKIQTIALRLLGKTGVSVCKEIRLRSVLYSVAFQQKLLKLSTSPTVDIGVRTTALQMMAKLVSMYDDVTCLLASIDLAGLLRQFVVEGSMDVACLAKDFLLSLASHTPLRPDDDSAVSTSTFRRRLLRECASMLSDSVDRARADCNVTHLLELLSACWVEDRSFAFTRVLEAAIKSVFYWRNSPRSSIYEALAPSIGQGKFPFEITSFRNSPPHTFKHILSCRIVRSSPAVISSERSRSLRFSQLCADRAQWVLIDLGSVCRVQDLAIRFSVSRHFVGEVLLECGENLTQFDKKVLFERVGSGSRKTRDGGQRLDTVVRRDDVEIYCRYLCLSLVAVTAGPFANPHHRSDVALVTFVAKGIENAVAPSESPSRARAMLAEAVSRNRQELKESAEKFAAAHREVTSLMQQAGISLSPSSSTCSTKRKEAISSMKPTPTIPLLHSWPSYGQLPVHVVKAANKCLVRKQSYLRAKLKADDVNAKYQLAVNGSGHAGPSDTCKNTKGHAGPSDTCKNTKGHAGPSDTCKNTKGHARPSDTCKNTNVGPSDTCKNTNVETVERYYICSQLLADTLLANHEHQDHPALEGDVQFRAFVWLCVHAPTDVRAKMWAWLKPSVYDAPAFVVRTIRDTLRCPCSVSLLYGVPETASSWMEEKTELLGLLERCTRTARKDVTSWGPSNEKGAQEATHNVFQVVLGKQSVRTPADVHSNRDPSTRDDQDNAADTATDIHSSLCSVVFDYLKDVSDENPLAVCNKLMQFLDELHGRVMANTNTIESEGGVEISDEIEQMKWCSTLISWCMNQYTSREDLSVHQGFACAVCGVSPIRGVRYRCANCPAFDMCEKCELGEKHHQGHVSVKIKTPLGCIEESLSIAPPSPYLAFLPAASLHQGDSVHAGDTDLENSVHAADTDLDNSGASLYWGTSAKDDQPIFPSDNAQISLESMQTNTGNQFDETEPPENIVGSFDQHDLQGAGVDLHAQTEANPSMTHSIWREEEEEEGVACDVCDRAICLRSVRFKCGVCEDVDLCASCEEVEGAHDPSHPLLRFRSSNRVILDEEVGAPLIPKLSSLCTIPVSAAGRSPDSPKVIDFARSLVSDHIAEQDRAFDAALDNSRWVRTRSGIDEKLLRRGAPKFPGTNAAIALHRLLRMLSIPRMWHNAVDTYPLLKLAVEILSSPTFVGAVGTLKSDLNDFVKTVTDLVRLGVASEDVYVQHWLTLLLPLLANPMLFRSRIGQIIEDLVGMLFPPTDDHGDTAKTEDGEIEGFRSETTVTSIFNLLRSLFSSSAVSEVSSKVFDEDGVLMVLDGVMQGVQLISESHISPMSHHHSPYTWFPALRLVVQILDCFTRAKVLQRSPRRHSSVQGDGDSKGDLDDYANRVSSSMGISDAVCDRVLRIMEIIMANVDDSSGDAQGAVHTGAANVDDFSPRGVRGVNQAWLHLVERVCAHLFCPASLSSSMRPSLALVSRVIGAVDPVIWSSSLLLLISSLCSTLRELECNDELSHIGKACASLVSTGVQMIDTCIVRIQGLLGVKQSERTSQILNQLEIALSLALGILNGAIRTHSLSQMLDLRRDQVEANAHRLGVSEDSDGEAALPEHTVLALCHLACAPQPDPDLLLHMINNRPVRESHPHSPPSCLASFLVTLCSTDVSVSKELRFCVAKGLGAAWTSTGEIGERSHFSHLHALTTSLVSEPRVDRECLRSIFHDSGLLSRLVNALVSGERKVIDSGKTHPRATSKLVDLTPYLVPFSVDPLLSRMLRDCVTNERNERSIRAPWDPSSYDGLTRSHVWIPSWPMHDAPRGIADRNQGIGPLKQASIRLKLRTVAHVAHIRVEFVERWTTFLIPDASPLPTRVQVCAGTSPADAVHVCDEALNPQKSHVSNRDWYRGNVSQTRTSNMGVVAVDMHLSQSFSSCCSYLELLFWTAQERLCVSRIHVVGRCPSIVFPQFATPTPRDRIAAISRPRGSGTTATVAPLPPCDLALPQQTYNLALTLLQNDAIEILRQPIAEAETTSAMSTLIAIAFQCTSDVESHLDHQDVASLTSVLSKGGTSLCRRMEPTNSHVACVNMHRNDIVKKIGEKDKQSSLVQLPTLVPCRGPIDKFLTSAVEKDTTLLPQLLEWCSRPHQLQFSSNALCLLCRLAQSEIQDVRIQARETVMAVLSHFIANADSGSETEPPLSPSLIPGTSLTLADVCELVIPLFRGIAPLERSLANGEVEKVLRFCCQFERNEGYGNGLLSRHQAHDLAFALAVAHPEHVALAVDVSTPYLIFVSEHEDNSDALLVDGLFSKQSTAVTVLEGVCRYSRRGLERLIETAHCGNIIEKIRVCVKDWLIGKYPCQANNTIAISKLLEFFNNIGLHPLAQEWVSNCLEDWIFSGPLLREMLDRLQSVEAEIIQLFEKAISLGAGESGARIASYLQNYLERTYCTVRENQQNDERIRVRLLDKVLLHLLPFCDRALVQLAMPGLSPLKDMTFDASACGPGLTVSGGGMAIEYEDCDGRGQWTSVRGSALLHPGSGVYEWEFIITHTAAGLIDIGVASVDADLLSYIGSDGYGWGYQGDGNSWHARTSIAYGDHFHDGDTIAVRLDTDNGSLSFSRNGTDLGICHREIKVPVYPALAFYNVGDSVTLRTLVLHGSRPQWVVAPDFQSTNRSTQSTTSLTPVLQLPLNTRLSSLISEISGFRIEPSTCVCRVGEEVVTDIHRPLADFYQRIVSLSDSPILHIEVLESSQGDGEVHEINVSHPRPAESEHSDSEGSHQSSSSSSCEFRPLENANGNHGGSKCQETPSADGLSFLLACLSTQERMACVTSVLITVMIDTGASDLVGSHASNSISTTWARAWLEFVQMSTLAVASFPGLFLTDPVSVELLLSIARSLSRRALLAPVGDVHGSAGVHLESLCSCPFCCTAESASRTWVLDLERCGFFDKPPLSITEHGGVPLQLVAKLLSRALERDALESQRNGSENVESALENILHPTRINFLSSLISSITLCLGQLHTVEPKAVEDTVTEIKELSSHSNVPKWIKGLNDNVEDNLTVHHSHALKRGKSPAAKSSQSMSAVNSPIHDELYWAKGVGFSTPSLDEPLIQMSEAERRKTLEVKDAVSRSFMEVLTTVIDICQPRDESMVGVATSRISDDVYSAGLKRVLARLTASPLFAVLRVIMDNDSLLDIASHEPLYEAGFSLIRSIANNSFLSPILVELPHDLSVLTQLEKMDKMAQPLLGLTVVIPGETEAPEVLPEPVGISSGGDEIARSISLTVGCVRGIQRSSIASEGRRVPIGDERAKGAGGFGKQEKAYKEALGEWQLNEVDMTNNSGAFYHHYNQTITASTAPGKGSKMKRLFHEMGSMRSGLPISWDSAILIAMHEGRADVLKALIFGPKDTPYENGCFVFDIYCGPNYPTSPPEVNLQTTGGGTIRFNPNLYNCGKVCLSLLGTWTGGAGESWEPSKSTLLQVLISIQSLILVENPYFNEPGYEEDMNTREGQEASELYNADIRLATLQYALLQQLIHPPVGFEEVIQTHFKLKHDAIIEQCDRWIAMAEPKSKNYQRLCTTAHALKEELGRFAEQE